MGRLTRLGVQALDPSLLLGVNHRVQSFLLDYRCHGLVDKHQVEMLWRAPELEGLGAWPGGCFRWRGKERRQGQHEGQGQG